MALGSTLPVYVWSGVKWMPYRPLWDDFATIVEWKPKCQDTINDIIATTTSALKHEDGRQSDHERKLQWINEHFAEYFSFQGMVQQIQWFLADGPFEIVPESRSRLHCEGTPDIKHDAHHSTQCEWIDGRVFKGV